jgi:hypothetical protein
MRLLLASINRLFEPPAEPLRRRAIGFLPQPVAGLEKEALHEPESRGHASVIL